MSAATGGRLILAATPIGDSADASARLARLIAEADLIAAEDTRRLRRLAADLGVAPSGRVVRHDEHTERSGVQELVRVVESGGTVLVVTDAGMPVVSDPGLRAVRAAVAAGLPVTAAPGPSAAITALALSGLPADRFCFEGFLPRAAGRRAAAIAALAGEPRTMLFFESPRRTAATLAALAEGLGVDRPAALCRELTKTHEQVLRDTLGGLAGWAAGTEVLGEVTLVVGGRPVTAGPADLRDPAAAVDVAALLARVDELTAGGLRVKDAVARVAAEAGIPKRSLYDAATRDR